ncbi:hypothetical protein AUEXF2481DRAFT_38105 [Aureobasidium subglaciale EXF-2481]|uniref:Uncharacterized protein n=1 Tax=Aureobasidium subglaciale (strain EXF-2481) TaxID=1043005 RepID=A0A074ZG65_AURSE|nr:uncharacterized protein AUEXF2481DRAFT_38105 [Aureobasidium subglaciale EXF-2481]KAI5199044.1 hypothetical protein E4T38_07204 [Aureobasidium subglaciale]KAI5217798.1 hypothetical protein E4T40_07215 [Aureobasidium subglaciale]KAI5220660.1 hypothetical protein E4T41_07369 [Aureobasidium subglaciale]KAI5258375.1 hypothetical protein E4T46_07346 [Aureobasidium subglaciale]KEQ97596.1 hypothetical protein AUEXF2481DRAFT_38105 [Aureobasidium subglaciale EXF-2481]
MLLTRNCSCGDGHVKGVRINCTVSHKLYDRPIFEDVVLCDCYVALLLKDGESSQIARRIGTPLLANLESQHNRIPNHPMNWSYAYYLHIPCELETEEDIKKWGSPSIHYWDRYAGDAVVIRGDKEPLSAKYLEALSAWCIQEMQPKFGVAMEEFDLTPRDDRRDVVALLTKENFEKYMKSFVREGKTADYDWRRKLENEQYLRWCKEEEDKEKQNKEQKEEIAKH